MIKNRLVALLAAFAVVLALLTIGGAATAPANAKDITWGRTAAPKAPQGRDITWGKKKAGWPGGTVDYTTYYGGTFRYINFFCDSNGSWGTVWPGQWSKNEGNCADAGGIMVEEGSKLFCGERYGITSYVLYPGYHAIGNFSYRACEKRRHAGSARIVMQDPAAARQRLARQMALRSAA